MKKPTTKSEVLEKSTRVSEILTTTFKIVWLAPSAKKTGVNLRIQADGLPVILGFVSNDEGAGDLKVNQTLEMTAWEMSDGGVRASVPAANADSFRAAVAKLGRKRK